MYQQLTIVGRLGRDPEMRYLANGDAVTSFSVAVDDFYGGAKHTRWFKVSVFGKQAENCHQYLTKGKLVLVQGSLSADDATGGPKVFTRNDGSASASFEVKGHVVKFLSPAGENDAAAPATKGASAMDAEDDDSPF